MAVDEEKTLKLELQREERIKKLQERIKRTKALGAEFRNELNDRLVIFLTTSFGVVAALFWQTAINDTIKAFIPVSGAWSYEIAVALFVTVISVSAIFTISRFIARQKPAEK